MYTFDDFIGMAFILIALCFMAGCLSGVLV